MIKFEVIRWKNFLSYGENWTELRLDDHEKTLIVGENGAGKSTFLDALSYALYMKPFRKINNPQLVNSINKRHMAVEVEFSIGSNHYRVCRGHAPRYFEVYQNGNLLNQEAHTKDYQTVLEKQILKMNHKSFAQIVVLGSNNFIPFMQLSAPQRREVIEDLLDIQIFSTMSDLLSPLVRENSDSLKEVKHQIELAKERIQMHDAFQARLKENKDEVIEERKADLKNREDELGEINEEIGLIEQDIFELGEPVIKEEYETKVARVNKLLQLESKIEDKIKRLREQVEFFELNNSCPTCGQEIDDDFKNNKVECSNKDIHESKEGLDKLAEEVEETQKSIDTLTKIKEQIRDKQRTLSSRSATAASIEKLILQIKQQISQAKEAETDQGSGEQDRRKFETELQAAENDIERLRHEKAVYAMASDLLRDSGIKARIIKQYVPIINRLINKYLAAMEFYVQFELDENFKEVIKSRFRDEFSYPSFSEGEKMRIDLALLFTWRSIAKLKNSASTNLLIMDEVMDSSLDQSGTDEFLKIISDLTLDTNTFIISHKTDQLLDKFNHVIKFEKKKNFSIMSI